jgi:hypothetical protein
MTQVLPECLLGSLFKNKNEIKIENNKFHKALYVMKGNPEYKELLGDIRFSGSPVSPYSEVLEEALFNLQFSGILSRRNPDLVFYSTTEQYNLSYKELTRGLPADTLNKLDKFSADLLERIN